MGSRQCSSGRSFFKVDIAAGRRPLPSALLTSYSMSRFIPAAFPRTGPTNCFECEARRFSPISASTDLRYDNRSDRKTRLTPLRLFLISLCCRLCQHYVLSERIIRYPLASIGLQEEVASRPHCKRWRTHESRKTGPDSLQRLKSSSQANYLKFNWEMDIYTGYHTRRREAFHD